MNLKHYVVLMLLTTSLCWFSFFYVVFNVDPTGTGFLGYFFFYISLFLALIGTNSILGLIFRMKYNKQDLPVFKLVTLAHRQAIWFAFLITGVLFLQSKNFLTWWNIILLMVMLTFLEFFILSMRKKQNY